ncbi:NAD(P)/FAD-dependent oxidoreductase [Natrialbaceae archaeon AArc-T1-2]|uniref:NAD(P)/FAD-dependent oxidoreductase n=1 Tax=Natrialbaceae archaeon AArc-T1-2 TaxID=3053904 RepID=UPI00255A86AD|nr:NAD(P)/FAD-dependent oxidoreductase [Natrialbaceae archaeon AArc-T1-2]WIV66497.1 NAD(P)/FAD-dependent oxidoreductase [Natrialbaceae archaeon AArc-T1-2]
MHTDDGFDYDVAVVGGGPAGLTSALYATRLGLDTLVVDRGGGRAAMMQDTHNVIGVTEDVSGNEFLETAREQVEGYGGTYERGFVEAVEPVGAVPDDGFDVVTVKETYRVCRVVLATGFADERPDPPLPRTGTGLHYCLHCDAFMFVDEPVYVMGTNDVAAYVAMIMLNYTDDVDLLTRSEEPTWSDETATLLSNHPVDVVTTDVVGTNTGEDGWLESLEFADGEVREYRGGFAMYGSNYHADLADSLGLERTEEGTVAVDDHGRTSMEGVYAVGDLTPGHNQIPIAMGQGAKAGIALSKELRAFPRSLEEVDAEGPVTAADAPAISRELLETAISHEGHAGGPREDVEVGDSEAAADD